MFPTCVINAITGLQCLSSVCGIKYSLRAHVMKFDSADVEVPGTMVRLIRDCCTGFNVRLVAEAPFLWTSGCCGRTFCKQVNKINNFLRLPFHLPMVLLAINLCCYGSRLAGNSGTV